MQQKVLQGVFPSPLSSQTWLCVQATFGGHCSYSLDLMALDSNAQRDILGNPLPHVTPFTSKGSDGVDLFSQCPNSGVKI